MSKSIVVDLEASVHSCFSRLMLHMEPREALLPGYNLKYYCTVM